MLFTSTKSLLLFLLRSAAVSIALGISCRGSAICSEWRDVISPIAEWDFPESRTYVNGQHIACMPIHDDEAGFCVFLQKASWQYHLSGREVSGLLDHLARHGCGTCGSVPIGFPYSNDPSHGVLTVNYVDHSNCGGVCR